MPRKSKATATTIEQDPFATAQLLCPKSSPYLLIFPSQANCFSSETFSPDETQGRIQEADVLKVLKSLRKSKYSRTSKNHWNSKTLAFLFVTFFFFVAVMVSFAMELIESGSIVFLLAGLFVAFLIVSGCINCLLWKLKKKRTAYLAHREADFNKRLQELNEKEFSAKQVRWVSGRYGAWLELHLEFMRPEGASQEEESSGETEKRKEEIRKAMIRNMRKKTQDEYGGDSSRSEYHQIVKAEEVKLQVVLEGEESDLSDSDGDGEEEEEDEEAGSSISSVSSVSNQE